MSYLDIATIGTVIIALVIIFIFLAMLLAKEWWLKIKKKRAGRNFKGSREHQKAKRLKKKTPSKAATFAYYNRTNMFLNALCEEAGREMIEAAAKQKVDT